MLQEIKHVLRVLDLGVRHVAVSEGTTTTFAVREDGARPEGAFVWTYDALRPGCNCSQKDASHCSFGVTPVARFRSFRILVDTDYMAKPKLADHVIQSIRVDAQNGATPAQLATAYGLARSTIYKILVGRAYPDAGGPLRAPRPRLKPDATRAEIEEEGRRRLLARSVRADNGCRYWDSQSNGSHGYFTMFYDGRYELVHRLAFKLFTGADIPDGYEVDHWCHSRDESCFEGDNCRHRRCLEPSHLRLLPHARNVQEGRSWAIHGLKEECAHGHAYDLSNTRFQLLPDGRIQRKCRTCAREYMRRKRARPADESASPKSPALAAPQDASLERGAA